MQKRIRTQFTQIIDNFQRELKECGYFAEFFDRLAKDESTLKMCDSKGEERAFGMDIQQIGFGLQSIKDNAFFSFAIIIFDIHCFIALHYIRI